MKSSKLTEYRYIINVLVLLAGTWIIWLSSFNPFPNWWVFEVPFIFGIIICASIYLHDLNINDKFENFVKDKSISENVKLARFNMEYGTWSRLLIALLSGYAIIAITVASNFLNLLNYSIINDEIELKGIFDLFWFSIVINASMFLFILCKEVVLKILDAQNQIEKIKKEDKFVNRTLTRRIWGK